jgi:hypothetical protein
MSLSGTHFMDSDDRILLTRLADYVRPYPEKVLARTIGCDERTAKHFRNGTSWPNARHWKLIVQAFGRDVIAAVFMPEIDDTLARLEREARQLENRLAEINARRRADAGDFPGPAERHLEALDRAPVDRDTIDLFETTAPGANSA